MGDPISINVSRDMFVLGVKYVLLGLLPDAVKDIRRSTFNKYLTR